MGRCATAGRRRRGAIVRLDPGDQADPAERPRVYLRARAKEASGQSEGALADYNLASRTAFAAAQDLETGEAHLYRGIVLFRRKDYTRAEDEFASALNFEIPAGLRADVRPGGTWRRWRRLLRRVAGASRAVAAGRVAVLSAG